MGQEFTQLSKAHTAFIQAQKLFFVATAGAEGRINLSPKGMDTLRVVDNQRVVWLNLTGSGNETAAHVLETPRMTLMFTAFEGEPMILRLYGQARGIHAGDPEWTLLRPLFPPLPGARQIFDLRVEVVKTSCGMAVPRYDFIEERDSLRRWAEKKGPEGIREYWRTRNQQSMDGKETEILARSRPPQ